MLKKALKVIVPIAFLLIGVWIGMGIKTLTLQKEYATQAPRKLLTITSIDENNRKAVFDGVNRFAAENAFAIRMVTLSPGDEEDTTIFGMWRSDVKILGNEIGAVAGILKVGFYDTERLYKTPYWVYEDLVIEFISYIKDIPNITITEEK